MGNSVPSEGRSTEPTGRASSVDLHRQPRHPSVGIVAPDCAKDRLGEAVFLLSFLALIAGRFTLSRVDALPDVDLRFVFLYVLCFGMIVWLAGRHMTVWYEPKISVRSGITGLAPGAPSSRYQLSGRYPMRGWVPAPTRPAGRCHASPTSTETRLSGSTRAPLADQTGQQPEHLAADILRQGPATDNPRPANPADQAKAGMGQLLSIRPSGFTSPGVVSAIRDEVEQLALGRQFPATREAQSRCATRCSSRSPSRIQHRHRVHLPTITEHIGGIGADECQASHPADRPPTAARRSIA